MITDSIPRRPTRQVRVGNVWIGSDHPIVVQSMTNTDTVDAVGTAQQIYDLWRAGSEMVRITVNSPEAASQVARIRDILAAKGCEVPIVGDFHFNGDRLLRDYPECAERWPNTASTRAMWARARKKDEKFAFMIEKSH